jgi:hypothetical protein
LVENILAATAPKFQPVSSDRVTMGNANALPLFSARGCAKATQGNKTQLINQNLLVSLILGFLLIINTICLSY